MKNFLKMFILLLLVLLNFSCIEKKIAEIEPINSEVLNTLKSDSLQFTSGIRVILQDRKGNYWLGSHTEGACKFNGKTFEYFTIKEGLPDNQVRSIQEDSNGTIWFETANGPCSYDGKTIATYPKEEIRNTNSKWIKTKDDLWFTAGNTDGVYRYDGQQIYFLLFPFPRPENTGGNNVVTSHATGKNNTEWIASYTGVYGYNGIQFTITDDASLGLNMENGMLHVRSVLEDSKGRLWIGNNGIGVLLKEGNTTINFSEKQNLIHPESKRSGAKSPTGTLEHVFAIEEDSEGNIWFGDRDTGAWKFDGTIMTNYEIDNRLSSSMIWCIYKDNANNLLFGMANAGVYKFNGKTFEKVF